MSNSRLLIRCLRYVRYLGRPGPDLSWITNLLGVSGTLYPRHIAELASMGVRSIIDHSRGGQGRLRVAGTVRHPLPAPPL